MYFLDGAYHCKYSTIIWEREMLVIKESRSGRLETAGLTATPAYKAWQTKQLATLSRF